LLASTPQRRDFRDSTLRESFDDELCGSLIRATMVPPAGRELREPGLDQIEHVLVEGYSVRERARVVEGAFVPGPTSVVSGRSATCGLRGRPQPAGVTARSRDLPSGTANVALIKIEHRRAKLDQLAVGREHVQCVPGDVRPAPRDAAVSAA
jgi:hypothetical protein